MLLGKKTLIVAAFTLFLAPIAPNLAAQDLNTVLAKLDAAATNFHSASADFEYDIVVTDPVPDKDVQKGSVYYLRKGSAFESGVHINETNGRPTPKIIVVADGTLKIYDKKQNQLTISKKVGKYESYLSLGFGASGKDLVQKFDVKYIGSEIIGNATTDKLELVAKDPNVLKYFPKITVWMDSTRGVSLKQVFDEGQGQSRICIYSNIKLNQSLPSDAFTFTTDKQTQVINQ